MIEEKRDYILIDFTGLLKTIWKKMAIIILIGVIMAGAGAGYGYYQSKTTIYTPFYASTVKMYVTGNYAAQPSTAAKALGQSYINDYYELMRGKKVINQVIADMQLNMTYKELVNCIKKSTVENTSMLCITVVFPDAQYAKDILDDLIKLTNAYALDVLGMTPPVIYEQSQVATNAINEPVNNTIVYGIYGGVAGLGLALIVIIFGYLSDKKIRSARKVEEETGIPVIGIMMKGKKSEKMNKSAMHNLFGHMYIMNKNAKVIAFYSMSNVEKSKLVETYATFLKENEKKTVCLDINLSNPNKGLKRQVSEETCFLEDYLNGKVQEMEELVVTNDISDEILCSKACSNAAELLCKSEFSELLTWLKERYDYVLINTAPLGYVPDSKSIMAVADVNIAVGDLDKTTVDEVRDLVKEFDEYGQVNGFVIGNVRMPRKKRQFEREFGKFVGV